ncbi:MAG: MBL fold metallo-hydrolase [Thermomicrobiales bacterium]
MPIPDPIFLTGKNLAFDEASEMIPAELTRHAQTMEQGIYQVAEDFYVAVGYGNANMSMVVGTDGVILIDSMENEEAAREVMADLRRFSDKPVKALIYTHSHPDHSSGSRGLLDPAGIEAGQVEIYAHERLLAGMRGNLSLGSSARCAWPILLVGISSAEMMDGSKSDWVRCCVPVPPDSCHRRPASRDHSTSRWPASASTCERPRANRMTRSCSGSPTTEFCTQRT